MAAVHFAAIPCKAITAHKIQGKPYFPPIFCPSPKEIVYVRFEDFRTFLYVVMSIFKIFVLKEIWINARVLVAICFSTEDLKVVPRESAID